MKTKLLTLIKRKFKYDIFNKIIKEDIEKHGKGMHSINIAYIGIEWAINQNDEIKKLIENSNYDKGFRDAIEKAKYFIINNTPLPSYKNHNICYDSNLLEERLKYAHQMAEKFEEMMNTDERGII